MWNSGKTTAEEDKLQKRPRNCRTTHAQCRAFQPMQMDRKVGVLPSLSAWKRRVVRGRKYNGKTRAIFPMNYSCKWYNLLREQLEYG